MLLEEINVVLSVQLMNFTLYSLHSGEILKLGSGSSSRIISDPPCNFSSFYHPFDPFSGDNFNRVG